MAQAGAPDSCHKDANSHSIEGLEFSAVANPGVGYLPNSGDSVSDEARLMDRGGGRAMDNLVMTCH